MGKSTCCLVGDNEKYKKEYLYRSHLIVILSL